MALLNNPQGQTVIVPISPNMELEFGFDPGSETQLSRDGDNLIFAFADGGQLVLTDFYALPAEELPALDIQGAQISAEDFLASLGDETLLPAAGPTAPAPTAPDSSGTGAYGDDAGSLIGGIDYLGMLGRNFWSQISGSPITDTGVLAAADPEIPGGEFEFNVVTPDGEGILAAGAYEDARPFQHLGDPAEHPARINFIFTPTGTTTVTSVQLSGFDQGTRLFVGDEEVFPGPGGVYTFTQAQFDGPGVFFIPPENSDQDMTLTAVVNMISADGVTGSATGSFPAIVDAVADKPDLDDASLGIEPEGYEGSLSFTETSQTQQFKDGWAEDAISRETATVTATDVTLTMTFQAILTFGDFSDGSEHHYALVEIPSALNISNSDFAAGEWSVMPTSLSAGLLPTYETITIYYINGTAYDTLTEATANGWATGGEFKNFFRFEVDNTALTPDPLDPTLATLDVSFEMRGVNTGITEDVSFILDAGTQAKEIIAPGEQELDLANNNSFTWVSEGEAGAGITVDVDTIESELLLQAGWVYEGNKSDKNLLSGSQDPDWTEQAYENEEDANLMPQADSYGKGAPVRLAISGGVLADGSDAGEHITKASFSFDSTEAVLRLGDTAITDGLTRNVDGTTYTFAVSTNDATGETTVSITLSGDAQINLNGLALNFVPANYFEDADIAFKYTVDVAASSGASAHYAGASTVVVDAVADISGRVFSALDTKASVSSQPDEAVLSSVNSDLHKTDGWETDTYKMDYSEVKYAFAVNVQTSFPDVDGSERHFVLVERPLDSDSNPDTYWEMGALPDGYTDAGTYTDPVSGKVYFKIEVDDSTQSPVNVPVTLKYNGTISGDQNITVKTGSYVQEKLDTDRSDEIHDHPAGREYDMQNNIAVRTDGQEVTYKIDVLNSELKVDTGWGSEGGNDAKHTTSAYHVTGDYAGSTGEAGSAFDGSAPIVFSLSGAAGSAETITSITLTLGDDMRGTLVPAPGSSGTLTHNLDGSYTLSGVNAASVTLYFKPASGSFDYSDVDLDYAVTVKNAAGSYTFTGDSQIVIDAVADKPGAAALTGGAKVTYPDMIDPVSGETVEQSAAKPGDAVTVHGKVTFPDVSGGEDHFILVENGSSRNDAYTLESVTIKAGTQTLTVNDFSGFGTVTIGTGYNAVTYYKIPVDNPAFTDGDKIGSFDVAVTITTTGEITHTNSVGFGGRAEVAQVDIDGDGTADRSGGAPGGAPNADYEFDLMNNESNTVTKVDVVTQGIETKDIFATGGDTYEHDWAERHLPDPFSGNVAGTATDESNTELSGGVNIGMTANMAEGEYISKVVITLWEPVDANTDGQPDSPTGWQEDSSRGHIVYDGTAYYPDSNGKITLPDFTTASPFDPSEVVFVADGYESGKVELRLDVTVTDSSNGYSAVLPVKTEVNVDAVATRSGAIATEVVFDDAAHTAAAGGETFTLNITTSFFDLDGSENKYVLIEQVPGFEPTGAYSVGYYDLDNDGTSEPYYKILVTDAMLAGGSQVTDTDGHPGMSLTVPVELKVTAPENLDGYALHTGTAVEETRIDRNAESPDYNNVAVRQGTMETIVVSDAHGGMRSESVWAYENDRADMHIGNQDPKGGVVLPVSAHMDANDSIVGEVTLHIDPEYVGNGVFTYGVAPNEVTLTFDSATGDCLITYDPAAALHFTPNDKVYDDRDIKVTMSGEVKDDLSGDISAFTSEVLIKMDAVASKPDLPTPGGVIVDYSGVVHNLENAHINDDNTAASQVPRGGGTIELNNITVAFHDFDGTEQHFLLIEAKAGMSVGGKNDWETFEQPVYEEDTGKLLGHTIYFKIPLDGAGAINPAYVSWDMATGTATVSHISVTLPEYRYDAQELDNISYGGLAHDQTTGGADAELDLDNNWAVNVDGSIDINWAAATSKGVWVEGLYENNTPNMHIGDDTPVYGKLSVDPDFIPMGATTVTFTLPRGILIDADGNEYPHVGGVYTFNVSDLGTTDIFVKLPEHDNLDTDLGLGGTMDDGMKYEFTVPGGTEIDWSFKGNPNTLVIVYDPDKVDIDYSQMTLNTGFPTFEIINDPTSPYNGWTMMVLTKNGGIPSQLDNLIITPKEGYMEGDAGYVFHAGNPTWSAIKEGGLTTIHLPDTKISGEVDVWVDAVAQIPLDISGEATTYSGGDKYAESGETVTLNLSAAFVDIDATTSHSILIEAKPGWECVKGDGTAYDLVYVDGKAYYSVPVTPDATTGLADIAVLMRTVDPDLLIKDANGIAHEEFKIGAMSVDKTVGDGELTLDNNTAVLFPEGAKVVVDLSPVDSAITVTADKGYEDNLGGGDGIAITLSGLSEHMLEGGGAQEVISQATFTFKAGTGVLNYDGIGYTGVDNGDGTVTVTIPGFDQTAALYFVPAANHSAADVDLAWTCTVVDQLSHETETFKGSATLVIDAVAHAPTAVGDDTLTISGDHDAVAPGGMFTAEFDVTFVNDSGDEKFILVEALPQWAVAGGAGYELVYPSGAPTESGGVFYKIPLDPAWTMTTSPNGSTTTVHAVVQLTAPTSLADDGSVDIRYGGMTYDPNTAGDGEITLANNVAYNAAGTLSVDYAAVQATGIVVTADTASMNEDSGTMQINFAPIGAEGDVIKDVTIKVPAGGKLLVGAPAVEYTTSGASVTITADKLGDVYFQPNAHWSGKVTLDITAGTLTDPASGAEKTVGDSALTDGAFTVIGVADAPTDITPSDPSAAVKGGTNVSFTVQATFADNDGSENHFILVQKLDGWGNPQNYATFTDPDTGLAYFRVPVAVSASQPSPTATVILTAPAGAEAGDVQVELKTGALAAEKTSGSINTNGHTISGTVTVDIENPAVLTVAPTQGGLSTVEGGDLSFSLQLRNATVANAAITATEAIAVTFMVAATDIALFLSQAVADDLESGGTHTADGLTWSYDAAHGYLVTAELPAGSSDTTINIPTEDRSDGLIGAPHGPVNLHVVALDNDGQDVSLTHNGQPVSFDNPVEFAATVHDADTATATGHADYSDVAGVNVIGMELADLSELAGNEHDFSAAATGQFVIGGTGNDIIIGSPHDDILFGGMGEDTLSGGLGDDIFGWKAADAGTPDMPVTDRITDFSMNDLTPNGNDRLDLRDLISSANAKNLDDYLSIVREGDNAELHIRTDGDPTSDASQIIVLENVYATHNTGTVNNTEAVDELIKQHIILNS